MQHLPTQFEDHAIRRVYDEDTEIWWFSVVDIIQVLTQQPDYQTARKYWNKLKERLGKEGSQSVTDCHRLKLPAADGKNYLTDVATAETLLRLVQSVPSPKAEPIKLWLAKVGYERMQEMADPALSLDRARETWQKHGPSEKWIQQRMTGQETRNKLTDYWANHDIKSVTFLTITHSFYAHARISKMRRGHSGQCRQSGPASCGKDTKNRIKINLSVGVLENWEPKSWGHTPVGRRRSGL